MQEERTFLEAFEGVGHELVDCGRLRVGRAECIRGEKQDSSHAADQVSRHDHDCPTSRVIPHVVPVARLAVAGGSPLLPSTRPECPC